MVLKLRKFVKEFSWFNNRNWLENYHNSSFTISL